MNNDTAHNETTSTPFYERWVNVPFAPARWPFFYGWMVMVVATLSIICSIPGQTAGVGVFTDSLIEALGVSRNQLSFAYLIGTITSGLILPYAGKLLDRLGVRFMGVFAALGLAVSLWVLSHVGTIRDSLSGLTTWSYLPVAVAAMAFLLIRFFGQGNMTMVGRVAMGRWFNYRRGLVTAISGVPVAFAFNAAPWILNKAIGVFGWREACWIMATVLGGGMAIVAFIFFRDNPEQCDLVMDGPGVAEKHKSQNRQLHQIHHEFTRGEAVKTIAFWAFAFGLAVHGLIITAIAFHITSIGEEAGKTRDQAVLIFFYSSFITVPARFVVSYFVDNTRLRLKWALLWLGLTICGYTIGLMYLYTVSGWWLTTIFLGLSAGVWGVLCNVAMPRYFGREHLGAISGLMMSLMVIASAIGPILYSSVRGWLGNYRAASAVVIILPVLIVALSCVTCNPQRKFAPLKKPLSC